MTRKEFYLRKSDALEAANDYARDYDGFVSDNAAECEPGFDYTDRDAANIAFGGTTPAVLVECANGDTALFAYWEESL